MLKNHFKIAWRNLFRNKTLSFINIMGLSLGMAFAMLIGMWIHFETSFNAFNKNKDRIALVGRNLLLNNEKSTTFNVVLPLYDELKNNYPEIKRATRLDWQTKHSLIIGNNKFNKTGLYVDPDFLKMFSFHIIKGNMETALNDPNSIVLTASLATALFGKEDPLGKVIKVDNQYNVQVSAIVQDAPKNSSVDFQFLAPFEFKVKNIADVRNSKGRWDNNFLCTMVELKEGVSMEALSKKIAPLLMQKNTGIKTQTLFLYPMARWRLYGEFKNWAEAGGKIAYIRLFGIIGIFILLIACVNFMNLSTARSEKRAREVGIRKTVGSRRGQLIIQFLTESMLTAFFAFLISIILIQILLPYLKDLGFEDVRFDFSNVGLLASMLAVCIITGLAAGSYPALYLSSFLPVKVLKGVIKQGKDAVNFRKVLVVSQFVISMALIISTIIVFQQINHAKNRSIGYDPNNLISLNTTQDITKNYDILKHDLLSTGYIEAVTKASSGMTWVNYDFTHFSWTGKDPNADISLDVVMTEWDYEKAARLKFIAGRPFSREYKTDSSGVILNEAALRVIGYKEPIGKTIKLGDEVLTITGVIKNVLINNPFKPVSPEAILFNPSNVNTVLIRLKEHADLKKSLAAIKPIVERYNPSLPFEYSFADEDFAKKFATENQVAKLAGIFAGLAIFISCLGLFGLAMFMAERRSKEISIRKVLGASVTNLWLLLSKEFVWLVLIACLIASPLAFWLMHGWLQNYEYRIAIHWWIFAIAGLLAVIVALITVSTQAIKAAVANPAKRLKAE
ncbi:MAG: transporter permease [Mucilaginibacter sp.]|nr:transporter permease [Mucilaginibacter sp.]